MGRFGDGVGVSADLALVFVSGGTPEQAAAAGERACALTGATATLGCSAGGVIVGGQGIEGHAPVSAWVGVLPGAALRAFHLQVMPSDEGAAVIGLPERGSGADEVALLLADTRSFPLAGCFADGEIGPVAGRSHLHGCTASVLVFP